METRRQSGRCRVPDRSNVPLQYLERKRYKMPGDYLWEFDANAFIQRLIEETGIAHTWKPVLIRLAEGDRTFSMIEQPGPPETAGKRRARELLWAIWERCAGDFVSHVGRQHPEVLARFYADFLIDNADLVSELEASFSSVGHPSVEVLQQLEQRAVPKWIRERFPSQ